MAVGHTIEIHDAQLKFGWIVVRIDSNEQFEQSVWPFDDQLLVDSSLFQPLKESYFKIWDHPVPVPKNVIPNRTGRLSSIVLVTRL